MPEYKTTLSYEVEFAGSAVEVEAKVLGYNELQEWIDKWKGAEGSGKRSDDDVLGKILKVGLTIDGQPVSIEKIRELDFRLVKGIVTGYLTASGVIGGDAQEKKQEVSA